MQKTRRLITTGLAVVMSLTVLAGCGSTSQPAASGSTCIVKKTDAKGAAIAKIRARGKPNAGTKVDVENFGYKDTANNKVDGYEIEIVRQISCALFGEPEKWEATGITAKTRMDLLNGDQIDFIAGTMTVTEARKKEVDFSDIYYTDGIGMLVMKNANIKTLKDMDGKAFGLQQGSTAVTAMQKKAEEAGIKVTFNQYNTYAEALTALQAGRVQAMSTDASILSSYAKKAPETVLLGERFSQEPYGIATKKGNDDLAKLINGVVQELQKSGQLQKWQEKWGIAKK